MREDKILLWAIINITGLIITIIGMFGVVGLLDFKYAIYVFILGTIITLVSVVVIINFAHSIRNSPGYGYGRTQNEGEDKQ